MHKRGLFGILLILLGALLFTRKDIMVNPGHIFGTFWPSLFVIPLGLFFHWLYFDVARRRGVGMLIPGGILLIAGLVCQAAALFDLWGYLWPGFLLAIAFGLLEFYWFGSRNRWLLVPVFLLGSMSALFFVVFTIGTVLQISFFGQSAVAIVLIAAGVFLLLGKRRESEF